MEQMTIDGATIAWSDTGTGEPTLLIHAGVFGAWFAPVAPHVPGRVIRVLRAGYADGPPPTALVTMAEHAAHAAALLDALGTGPATVVGHSSGTLIVLELAEARPDLVRRMVLSEPPLIDPLIDPADVADVHAQVGAAIGAAMAATARGDRAGAYDAFMGAVCGPAHREVVADGPRRRRPGARGAGLRRSSSPTRCPRSGAGRRVDPPASPRPPCSSRARRARPRPTGSSPGSRACCRSGGRDGRGREPPAAPHPPARGRRTRHIRKGGGRPVVSPGMTAVPTIELNNGVTIPQLGFGVFLVPPGETEAAVATALSTGYRHIDTARLYENEDEVGTAIAKSGVPRDEVFVTTKVWNSDQGYDTTLAAFDKSLDRLGFDYVDLYLIHWPLPKVGPLRRDVARAGEDRGRRPGAGDRGVELPGRAPAAADRRDRHRARRQPGGAAPAPHPGAAAGVPRAARDRHRGLEPAGPRRRRAHRPADHRDRAGARQDPGPGDPALAPAGGHGRHPEVGDTRAGSPRTSTCSASRSPTTRSPRSRR